MSAQVVVKNLSTGIVDSSGAELANGVSDADYVIAAGGTGEQPGATPRVLTTPLPGGWMADAASVNSRWLVLNGSGNEGVSVSEGTYLFRTTVDLTGFTANTARLLNLSYATDNKIIAVRVNGTAVFTQDTFFAEEFDALRQVTATGLGLFHAGLNTIQFDVDNLVGVTPMGLRVEGTVVAQPVPEPGSFVLAAAAAGLAWRRRHQPPVSISLN
jgi:hypothetical protein